jgi:hypothetical protein
VPPSVAPPVPEVPPPAGAPPLPEPLAGAWALDPVAELAAGATAALELDAFGAALEEAELAEVGVVGVVVVPVLPVLGGAAATAEVGIVRAGASALSAAGGPLLPHPASASVTRTARARAVKRNGAVRPPRMTQIMRRRAAPSGARSAGSR